jgi:hypothetical protein
VIVIGGIVLRAVHLMISSCSVLWQGSHSGRNLLYCHLSEASTGASYEMDDSKG